MAGSLYDLVVNVSTNIATLSEGFNAAAANTEKASQRMSASLQGVEGQLKGLGDAFKTVAGVLGIGLSIGGLVEMTKQVLDTEVELGHLAERTGATITQLEAVREAAVLAGRNFGEMASSFDRISKSASEASAGTGAAALAYRNLGISVTDANGRIKESGTLYQEVAVAQSHFADNANKIATLQAIGGRGMAENIPALNELARGHELVSKNMEENVRQARELEKALGELKLRSEEFRQSLFADIAPKLLDLLNVIKASGGITSFLFSSASLSDATDTAAKIEDVKRRLAETIKLRDELIESGKGQGLFFNWASDADTADARIRALTSDLERLEKLLPLVAGNEVPDRIPRGGPKAFQVEKPDLASIKAQQEAIDAAKKSAEAFASAMRGEITAGASLQAELDKLNGVYNDTTKHFDAAAAKINELELAGTHLTAAQKAEILVLANENDALENLVAHRRIEIEFDNAAAKAEDDYTAAIQREVDARRKHIEALVDDLAKLKEGNAEELIRQHILLDAFKTQDDVNVAIAEHRLQILLDQQAVDQFNISLNRQIEIQRQVVDELRSHRAAVQAITDQANTFGVGWNNAWKQYTDGITEAQIAQGGFNTLTKGMEDLFVGMANHAKDAFAKFKDAMLQYIEQIAAKIAVSGILQLLGASFGGVGLGGGSGGILGGLLSGAGNAAGSSLLSGLFGLGGAAGAGLGAAGGAGVGFGAGLGAEVGFGATGAAVGLAAVPVAGWVALAAIAAYSIWQANKEPSPVEGQFGVRPTGGPASAFEDAQLTSNKTFGFDLGFLDQGTKQFSGAAGQVFNQIVSGALDDFATRFSPEQSAHFADVLKDMTFEAFSGTFTTEDFLQKYGGTILKQVVEAAFNEIDAALAKQVEAFSGTATEIAQFTNTLLNLYDATKTLPDAVRANIESALDSTQATADKVLAFARVLQTLEGPLSGLHETFLKLAGADIPALVDALGGVDSFTKAQAFLFDNFTTSADKTTLATNQLTDALNALGEGSVQTHQQFIDALNAALAGGDTALYASLLKLEQLFVEVHGTADQAAGGIGDLAQSIDGLNDAISPLNSGLKDFYTTAQQTAAASQRLEDDFAAIGLAVPQTHQAFLDLLGSIDRSSDAGEALYQAVFKLAAEFLQVRGTADQAAQSLNNVATSLTNVASAGTGLQNITNAATKFITTFLNSINTLADASTGDFGDKLTIKINLINDEIATLTDEMTAYAATTGGIVDATLTQYQEEIQQLKQTLGYTVVNPNHGNPITTMVAGLTTDLAQFTIWKAQYGAAIAEQLVDLQHWYTDQQLIFRNNADALSALSAIYQDKWAAIIAGTSSGVTGTLDQLDKLRQGIAQYLQSLALGNLSPLTAQQKFTQAQSAYNLELTKALGGDQGALGDVTKFADAFLQQAADFYAIGSEAYSNIYSQVTEQLGGIAGTTPTGTPLQSDTNVIVSALPLSGQKMASSEDLQALGDTLTGKLEELITALAAANTSDSAEVVGELSALETAVVGAIKDLATSGR